MTINGREECNKKTIKQIHDSNDKSPKAQNQMGMTITRMNKMIDLNDA
jgi:hypothetical protein